MKALSVIQPWAWLIVHGYKDIENRDWCSSYAGQLLIHASKKKSRDEWTSAQWAMDECGLDPDILPQINDVSYGAIVGICDLIGWVDRSQSPWFYGQFGWKLQNARAFKHSIPCRGALGLWEYSGPLIEVVA